MARKRKSSLTPAYLSFGFLFLIKIIGVSGYAMLGFSFIEGVYRNYYKDNIVKRKIDRLQDHVVICGYGRNGSQAAQELMNLIAKDKV